MRTTLILLLVFLQYNSFAQGDTSLSEIEKINRTIFLYIDGTANGEPEKVKQAFHPDFNLYSVTEQDSLQVWRGEDYISKIKIGEKSKRIGRVISIDFEHNTAIAKAEIVIPNFRIFTDYFLLLKYKGSWKIIHKSYTYRDF
ncbi:nuclear transport factor 2 family protein [Flavobacterium sp. ASW18X]|uniref:nuclear transport factor 2 family protein n=1 Tax=Flavobacterium sp. ASW18X TaxID=2572595 RepID=UPI0010AEDE3F|nr:nuclear transport factor 2 family protein [Flavobacterium sp. ASW18X]TKD65177.1 nuclear transport factor 2 family protein [Flavobacterium sp. ASW18X]